MIEDLLWRSVDRGNTWEQLIVSGSSWSKRYGHCVVVIEDVIYLMGGSAGANIIARIFDGCYETIY